MRRLTACAALVAALSAAPPAPGQEPGGERRDPTDVDPAFRKGSPAGPVGPARTAAVPIPTMALKGLVARRDRPAAALIEVNGRLFRVQAGAVITAPGTDTAVSTLKVLAVGPAEVRIEVSPQAETVVLR